MEAKKSMLDNIKDYLSNLTEKEKEELQEYFKGDSEDIPKGWVSIEDHLPKMYAVDIEKGYTSYKVKHKNGTTGSTCVSDHNTWYRYAKQVDITHWWND